MKHKVGPAGISALQFWTDSTASLQLLAVGDMQGTLHILEVPRALRVARQGASHVKALLMREVARVKYMEQRMQFRATELAVKEAEDEQRGKEAAEAAARVAAEEKAALEAAELAAQAAAGETEPAAPDLAPSAHPSATVKLTKAEEAAEAKYTALQAAFRDKIRG